MKISQMIQREDFYAINERTLLSYYRHGDGASKLFIYPHINAIITKRPSAAVKEFLYREFDIRSHALKRLLVKGYALACLNSFGLLSSKRVTIPAHIGDSTLIYPCNKKYRIFDFENGTISVLVKEGFPTDYFRHEIAFRSREELPDFVAPLLRYDEGGYCEAIIGGYSLARMRENYDDYRDRAYEMFRKYASRFNRRIRVMDYIPHLRRQMDDWMASVPGVDRQKIHRTVDTLAAEIVAEEEVELTFSHGDLQAGNIWVESDTDKIYILDWESWGERSVWYDEATLYHGLRPAGITAYLHSPVPLSQKIVVTMEDMVSLLRELSNLPAECVQNQLDVYLAEIETWRTSSINR